MIDKTQKKLYNICDDGMRLLKIWELESDDDDPYDDDWQRFQDHRKNCEKCLKHKESEK